MDPLACAAAGFAQLDVPEAIRQRALQYLEQWLKGPEFEAYRPQILWLISERQWAGLLDRFYQVLPFGTGGRRGPVGIGPNRMNPWSLAASVQGHCDYLRERFPAVRPLAVVLAYDVRRFDDVRRQYHPQLPNPVLGLTSRDLARVAAGVYAANGIISYLLPASSSRYLATPELSFAIRYYKAQGGLNISASHNPPDDNGGKFYDERGGQPVPPDDQIMADLVEQVQTIHSLPWAEVQKGPFLRPIGEDMHEAYLRMLERTSLLGPARPGECAVVFTPLHGVGGMTAMELLQRQRYEVIPVPQQMEPDGKFPAVFSPNPEVPGAFAAAEAVASAHPEAQLVLATDPDADRIGALARRPSGTATGSDSPWRYLTGNEIAALVTHFKLQALADQGRLPSSPLVIKTEVTTRLVTLIARRFNCQVVDNLLVGFKYIANVLRHLEDHGHYEDVYARPEDLVIACEESHGILTTSQLRDKDAAGAALLLAELALHQKRRGRTVTDYLEAIFQEFGYHHTEVRSLAMSGILGKQQMQTLLDGLRKDPPRTVCGLAVTDWEDLLDPNGRLGPIKGDTDAASRNVLLFRLQDSARLALRPSGTEPKAKLYIETWTPPRSPGTSEAQWQQLIAEAIGLARRLGDEFLHLAYSRVGLSAPA
jgi:phosphoglucomutase/phosphomannomutase